MNNQERLFVAIGDADPELLARSECQRHRWPVMLAAAACLLLVLTLGRMLPLWLGPEAEPLDGPASPVGSLCLPEQGSEIGTLRLLRYAPQSEEEAADFLIYVNKERYTIQEENGLYSIRSVEPLPDGFPACGLDVLHLAGTSTDKARDSAAEALQARYKELRAEGEAAVLPGSLYLRAGNGTAWDSEQTELWFTDDGQGGCFVLTARYFLEAEEGLGVQFRDMVSSFRVISPDEAVPEWMRALYETADRLYPALLSNDLSGISGLLTPDAIADAYGENVWKTVTIASVDYALDDDKNPSSAVVSVKHRLNQEEGESFNYLTMKLVRQDGSWRLLWSGIEK